MRMGTLNQSSQGSCFVPTPKQLCGGQLGMRQLSVSKPSSEGPSLTARTVLMTGYAPIVSHAPASPAQRLLQDQGTHSHPLSHRERDCSRKKNLQNGRFGCRLWGQDELAHSAAASRAGSASCSRRGGDRSCRYVEERASTKGCVVLSAGKGKGKAQESCKPGWERNFFGCHIVPHAYTEQ